MSKLPQHFSTFFAENRIVSGPCLTLLIPQSSVQTTAVQTIILFTGPNYTKIGL